MRIIVATLIGFFSFVIFGSTVLAQVTQQQYDDVLSMIGDVQHREIVGRALDLVHPRLAPDKADIGEVSEEEPEGVCGTALLLDAVEILKDLEPATRVHCRCCNLRLVSWTST